MFSNVFSGFSGARPMSESDFFALGETADRVELFDGSLHVTVNPCLRHQRASGALCHAFRAAADRAGLNVLSAVNVRLAPGRVPTTDLVIATTGDDDEIAVEADSVQLVGEILSPGNHAVDKVLKAHYYATAGIPVYLIVDPYARTLSEVLRLTQPVAVDLDPAALLPG